MRSCRSASSSSRWEESDDGRVAFCKGGRAGDVFYRDRWSHDKVVRSTHGVTCTGSCWWKVYVRGVLLEMYREVS
jgi:nitrate reductase alpha subunit